MEEFDRNSGRCQGLFVGIAPVIAGPLVPQFLCLVAHDAWEPWKHWKHQPILSCHDSMIVVFEVRAGSSDFTWPT